MKRINLKIPKIFRKSKRSSKKVKRVLNLIHNYMYIYEDNSVFKEEIHFLKGIVTSSISFKDVVNISFKLSKAFSEDELLIEAEKYVYDQNILDLTKEYQIIYNFQKYEEFFYVDAFAVEVDKLKSLMSPYLDTFKYIDFISFAPFAFKEFYFLTNTVSSVDVFIYFNTDDAYVVGFKGGEFVFIRALDKFSILQRELNKSPEEIIEILKVKGVDKNRYDDEYTYEIIDTFFSKFFMKVNNVINYSVNFFKLDRVNKIYFYAPFEINGLIDSYKDFWNLSNIEFKKYNVLSDYDPFEYTLTLYNSKYFENENLNFSIFKRPPPFYKRESGKLVLFTLFLIFLVILSALYEEYLLSKIEMKKMLIELQASNYKAQLDRIKKDIKKYDANIKSLQKELKVLNKKVDNVYLKVEKLYQYSNKPLFTNEYVKIVSLLKKYNLKIYYFKKKDNQFSLMVLSSQATYDNIPLLLIDLRKIGFKNIRIHSIDNNSTSYRTKVMFDE